MISSVLLPMRGLAPVLTLTLILAGCGSGGSGGGGKSDQAASGPGGTSGQAQTEKESSRARATEIGPVEDVKLGEIDQELVAEGKTSFQNMCSTCHQLDKRMVGPALRGVTDRRSPEFIMNMILNPSQMQSEHPVVKKQIAEFGTRMSDLGIEREEARALLEYLRSVEDQPSPASN